MFKKTVLLVVSFFVMVLINGCATTRKQSDLEIQGLKNHVSVLETQLQSKDEEISSLREALNKSQDESTTETKNFNKKAVAGKSKSHPSIKEVQIALKNAGYNPGVIDGKAGKQTKEAIKSFQKANNLTISGKVSKKTWRLLRKYLTEKVK